MRIIGFPCPFALYTSGLIVAKVFAKEVEIWSGGGVS